MYMKLIIINQTRTVLCVSCFVLFCAVNRVLLLISLDALQQKTVIKPRVCLQVIILLTFGEKSAQIYGEFARNERPLLACEPAFVDVMNER